MKTLAELKAKLQPGTQIRQIMYRDRDCDHLITITQVQTNGFWGTRPDMEKRGWMDFPKRKDILFTDNGFCRLESDKKLSEYVWVESEEEIQQLNRRQYSIGSEETTEVRDYNDYQEACAIQDRESDEEENIMPQDATFSVEKNVEVIDYVESLVERARALPPQDATISIPAEEVDTKQDTLKSLLATREQAYSIEKAYSEIVQAFDVVRGAFSYGSITEEEAKNSMYMLVRLHGDIIQKPPYNIPAIAKSAKSEKMRVFKIHYEKEKADLKIARDEYDRLHQ